MSFFTPLIGSSPRYLLRQSIQSFWSRTRPLDYRVPLLIFARFNSNFTKPTVQPVPPTPNVVAPDNLIIERGTSVKVASARKAPLLVGSLRKSVKPLVATPTARPAKDAEPSSVFNEPKRHSSSMRSAKDAKKKDVSEDTAAVMDEKEQAIQRRIISMRRKLLWPGIWTALAVAGTYGTLAYLDVKAGVSTFDSSGLPDRAQLPQTWYLTPKIFLESTKAAWNELDNLTIGIVLATFAIHVLKRSSLPIWEKLVHVTGEAKWTAFTYPLVNSSWSHAARNMAALVWILPGVVCYFDGDHFHTAAFLISTALITSYLTHFLYRFNLASGLKMSVGASGTVAAAFGVYSVAYANEKLWTPPGLILRLDSMYWAILFLVSQAYIILQTPKGGNRPACLIHLASLGLGSAYAYFNLKHHLWIPLVSEISSTQG